MQSQPSTQHFNREAGIVFKKAIRSLILALEGQWIWVIGRTVLLDMSAFNPESLDFIDFFTSLQK